MGNSTHTTTLYRAFNNQGELLYVGISNNFFNRLQQHNATSKWHKLANHVTLQHFETRQLAEEAEIAAIHNEKPLFNKKDNEDWHNSSTHLTRIFTYQDTHHKKVVEAHARIVSAMNNFDLEVSKLALYCYAFQSAIQVLYPSEEELDIPCVSCERLYSHDFMEEKSMEFIVADSIGYRAGKWNHNDVWEATVKGVIE